MVLIVFQLLEVLTALVRAGAQELATGTSASFNYPLGITTDGTNPYVSDTYNHRILKIE